MYFNIFIVLMFLSIICISIEFFIPGFGIFGILGLVLFVTSSIILVLKVPYGVNLFGIVVFLLGFLISFILRLAKKFKLKNKLILTETLNEDKKDMVGLDYFEGKIGTTKTDLKPFGIVQFGSIEVEAASDGVYIKQNTQIKVYKVDNNKLVVKKLSDFNKN